MNHVAITIQTTDNRTQAFGYDPKSYDNINLRNADIVNNLTQAKKTYGKKVAMVCVAEWGEDEEPSGIAYSSIDEVIAMYKPKSTKKEQ